MTLLVAGAAFLAAVPALWGRPVAADAGGSARRRAPTAAPDRRPPAAVRSEVPRVAARPVAPPALPPGAPLWRVCPIRIGDVPGIQPHLADPRLEEGGLLVVSKSLRRAMVFDAGVLRPLPVAPAEAAGASSDLAPDEAASPRACWRIGLGYHAPTGPKTRRGDMKTPEGWYRTSDKPWSRGWAGSIAIHYPNVDDAVAAFRRGELDRRTVLEVEAAAEEGVRPPQHTSLGGDILIHGGGSAVDWTDGCIALDDHDLRTLRGALGTGARTDALFLP